ncbi:uncharacterized protein LOC116220555 isoform X1 [Clupea harengus]|uniref:Uncharacterized protein LOC116220555 isoform X1 n=1 Tax=Clupea harengus TaxID=7950 RepID=A0A6P8FM66_CLUHA|nr:uncharacterized protein LOC116220555 isoform X1 [Clupea harengus]
MGKMASFTVFLPSFYLFWIITPYFLFAFTHVHGLPKPELFVSSSVILPTTTVHLSCVVPQDPVDQCIFMVGKTYTTSTSSCELTLTGEQIIVRGHVNPPSVLPVKCFYTVKGSGVNRPSDHSSPVSVLVLDNLQKPKVSVHHDRTNKLFDIVCEIPKQSWNVTGCQFYTGHGENLYPTAKIASGNCHLYSVDEDDLFRRLQSVGSGEVSCDYIVNTEPSSLSPRSDPYTIQGQYAQNIINVLLNTYY